MKKEIMMFRYKDILIDISPKSGSHNVLDAISDKKMIVGDDKKKGTYWNHFSDKIISEVSEEDSDLIKIKIIRNPDDRALSVYLHYMRHIYGRQGLTHFSEEKHKNLALSFFNNLKKIHNLSDNTQTIKSFYNNNLDYISELFGNINYKIFEMFSLQKSKISIDYNFISTLNRLNLLTEILKEKKGYDLIFSSKKLNQAPMAKSLNYFNKHTINLINDIYAEDYDMYHSNRINKWIDYD